jgi:hypothetical protein
MYTAFFRSGRSEEDSRTASVNISPRWGKGHNSERKLIPGLRFPPSEVPFKKH